MTPAGTKNNIIPETKTTSAAVTVETFCTSSKKCVLVQNILYQTSSETNSTKAKSELQHIHTHPTEGH